MTQIYNPTKSYFVENGRTLELWWMDTLVHSWTIPALVAPSGSPMGLLLAITYPVDT